MTGAEKNYKFGQKNNWRRRVANQVLSRTNGKEQYAPIIYLAGPQDIDRDVFTEKGVHPQNLIAIDRDKNNARSVSERGYPAIHSHSLEALCSWPRDWEVSAVLLDFCGGLTNRNSQSAYAALVMPPFLDSVVMVNMLRGRDAESNEYRAEMGAFIDEDSSKHRARLWYADALRHYTDWIVRSFGGIDECFKLVGVNDPNQPLRLAEAWALQQGFDLYARNQSDESIKRSVLSTLIQERELKPFFYSYRSGDLVFDSVVLTNRSVFGRTILKEGVWESSKKHSHYSAALHRKIVAMRAVRTRRLAA